MTRILGDLTVKLGLAVVLLSSTAYATPTPALRLNGTDMTNVSYPTGNLRLQLGNVGGNSNYGILESLTPTDANGAATWYDTVVGTVFFGTKKDWVRDIGWNLTANGTRVDTSDAAIGDQWESHYDADATHSWVERHVVFIGTDGTYSRPWTIQVARTAGANAIGYTNFGIGADNLQITPSTYALSSQANFAFINPANGSAGQFQINNSGVLRINTNNVASLTQVNAANNAAYTLAYVDASNVMHYGDANSAGMVFDVNMTGNVAFSSAASRSIFINPAAADTNGTTLTIKSGDGGAASATGGGTGGTANYTAANGGSGTASLNPGNGGQAVLAGGAAGSGGTGNASGGDVAIRGGTKSGTGTLGRVNLGDANTSAVRIGINGGVNLNLGQQTVAQATNVNTGVTVNAPSMVITTQTATTAARTAETGFTVTNNAVVSASVIQCKAYQYSGTLFTNGQPDVDVTAVANGSFNVRIINRDATNALSGTMKIHCVAQ